jgi:hypothetical protein
MIVKPQCDEAAILASPCDASSPANGGWIISRLRGCDLEKVVIEPQLSFFLPGLPFVESEICACSRRFSASLFSGSHQGKPELEPTVSPAFYLPPHVVLTLAFVQSLGSCDCGQGKPHFV